jgi:hypothetical protein
MYSLYNLYIIDNQYEKALKAILLAQIKFFALLKVCVLFAKFVIE